MSKPSPPPPPNPRDVAAAQTSSNIGTAIANSWMGNANTYGPLGQTTYQHRPSQDQIIRIDGKQYRIPTWSVHQELSPRQAELLKQQEQTALMLGGMAKAQARRVDDVLSSPIRTGNNGLWIGGPQVVNRMPSAPNIRQLDNNWLPDLRGINENRLPELQDQLGDIGSNDARKRVEEALFSRLEPQFTRDMDAMVARLAGQGVTPGTEAYRNAMDEMRRTQTDARYQAVLAGGQEQSRIVADALQQANFENMAKQQGFTNWQQMIDYNNNIASQIFQNRVGALDFNNAARTQQFNLDTTSAQQQMDLRNKMLQEVIALRNQPIAETSALMSGSQPTMPNFQGWTAGHVSDVPVGQYFYNSAALAQKNYQSQLAASQGLWGGLGSIFGSLGPLFGLSDERAKTDIEPVGKADSGVKLYSFRYKGQDPATPKVIGPMAQEVVKKRPEAVARFGELLAVNYDRALSKRRQRMAVV